MFVQIDLSNRILGSWNRGWAFINPITFEVRFFCFHGWNDPTCEAVQNSHWSSELQTNTGTSKEVPVFVWASNSRRRAWTMHVHLPPAQIIQPPRLKVNRYFWTHSAVQLHKLARKAPFHWTSQWPANFRSRCRFLHYQFTGLTLNLVHGII